jgi:hypothetical protein
MKKLFFIVVLLSIACGCSSMTDAVYGPDMTPDQLKDAIYQDAYAIGSIRASGKAPAEIDKYVQEAVAVRSVADPESYLTAKFLESLRDGDQENAFIYYTARRLYQRVGAKLINENINTDGLNIDLFHMAVDAYVDGLKMVMSSD